MQGQPKWFNTRYDLEQWRKIAGDAAYKTALQGLYEGSKIWVTTEENIEGDGITDDTHRVIDTQDPETNEIIKCQQELVVDKNSFFFKKIGFTPEEFESATETIIPLTKIDIPEYQVTCADLKSKGVVETLAIADFVEAKEADTLDALIAEKVALVEKPIEEEVIVK